MENSFIFDFDWKREKNGVYYIDNFLSNSIAFLVLLMKYYLGIDIGSTTFKAVVITDKGRVVHTTYQRTKPVDSGSFPARAAALPADAATWAR